MPSTTVLLAVLALLLYPLSLTIHRNFFSPTRKALPNTTPPPMAPHSPYLLGLDHFRNMIRHSFGHTLLPHIASLFDTLHSQTWREPDVLLGLLGGGTVVTADRENVKAVLAAHFEDYAVEPVRHDLGPYLGMGIFTADGERWATMRGRLRGWFGRAGGGRAAHAVGGADGLEGLDLYDLKGRSEVSMLSFMARLKENWVTGATVDLSPLIFNMLMEVACPMVIGCEQVGHNSKQVPPKAAIDYRNKRTWHRLGSWGFDVSSGVPDGHDISLADFELAFDRCSDWLSNNGDIRIFGIGLPSEGYYRDCKLVEAFVGAYAADAITRRSEKVNGTAAIQSSEKRLGALVDHLAAAQPPLPYELLRNEALHVLFAARDTTAGTLCDLFWLLARNQRVLDKLREEVLSSFPAGTAAEQITFERVKQLPYLNATIKETLRLHPVLPINSKTAVRDTVLPRGGGKDGLQPLAIREGTQVGWVTWALHRSPDVYGDDVEAMRPERWLDGAAAEDGWLEDGHQEGEGEEREKAARKGKGIRPGWAYVPFNGGPRTCIGQQFALGTMSYVAIRLIQEMEKEGLRMDSRDERPWTEKFSVSAKNLHGCLVAFVDAGK